MAVGAPKHTSQRHHGQDVIAENLSETGICFNFSHHRQKGNFTGTSITKYQYVSMYLYCVTSITRYQYVSMYMYCVTSITRYQYVSMYMYCVTSITRYQYVSMYMYCVTSITRYQYVSMYMYCVTSITRYQYVSMYMYCVTSITRYQYVRMYMYCVSLLCLTMKDISTLDALCWVPVLFMCVWLSWSFGNRHRTCRWPKVGTKDTKRHIKCTKTLYSQARLLSLQRTRVTTNPGYNERSLATNTFWRTDFERHNSRTKPFG